jgi:hypothetical protein
VVYVYHGARRPSTISGGDVDDGFRQAYWCHSVVYGSDGRDTQDSTSAAWGLNYDHNQRGRTERWFQVARLPCRIGFPRLQPASPFPADPCSGGRRSVIIRPGIRAMPGRRPFSIHR